MCCNIGEASLFIVGADKGINGTDVILGEEKRNLSGCDVTQVVLLASCQEAKEATKERVVISFRP